MAFPMLVRCFGSGRCHQSEIYRTQSTPHQVLFSFLPHVTFSRIVACTVHATRPSFIMPKASFRMCLVSSDVQRLCRQCGRQTTFWMMMLMCIEIGTMIGAAITWCTSCVITDKMFRGPSEKQISKVFELCSTHMLRSAGTAVVQADVVVAPRNEVQILNSVTGSILSSLPLSLPVRTWY